MKYHKIRNVPINVCTAEQKVAYNMAFRAHITWQDQFNVAKKVSRICADDLIHQIIMAMISIYQDCYAGKGVKYDIDAIQSCLNAGLYNYLSKPFIAVDYGQIGHAFPAHYLES